MYKDIGKERERFLERVEDAVKTSYSDIENERLNAAR